MQTPKAPDPVKTAAAQQKMNTATAVTQSGLNSVNQVTPQGNLTYAQIGKWDDGTPRFQATQTYSPQEQALYDNTARAEQKYGNIANNQLDAVGGSLSTPFNFDAAAATKLSNMQNTFLDPQWAHQGDALDTQLANQGIMPGSEAYTRAKQDFSTQRQHAYDQNYLDSYNTASNQALTERNQPLNETSALLSGSQVQQPNFVNTPNTPVSGVDYAGLVNQQYQSKVANQNAMMGGMFGLAGTALGGWARGGMMSDRRLKRDIKRVGMLDNGLPVYSYRFGENGATMIGVMADEVEQFRPEAVADIGGVKMVRYDLAVA